MDSPVREYPIDQKPTTPRYLVSPGTVAFLEERWKTPPAASSPKACQTPSPVLLQLDSPSSPDLSQFSPNTEEFIQWQFLELFGPSPVKDLLSPLPATPPKLASQTSPVAFQEHDFAVPLRPAPRRKGPQPSATPSRVSSFVVPLPTYKQIQLPAAFSPQPERSQVPAQQPLTVGPSPVVGGAGAAEQKKKKRRPAWKKHKKSWPNGLPPDQRPRRDDKPVSEVRGVLPK